MIELDGSVGEGGGQILRTALALSAVTTTPFRIRGIRAGRARPGLMRQHLGAVQAAAAVCGADVEGEALGATELTFRPGALQHGTWHVDLSGAGSTTLVLQTVLPPLLVAGGPSRLRVDGGTHNPAAPPAPFLDAVFAPLVRRMGGGLDVTVERPGFYPAGGGRLWADITPGKLRPIELLTRGGDVELTFTALVSALPRSVADRELFWLARELGRPRGAGRIENVADPRGPGNVVWATLAAPACTELISSFGEKGVRAEVVASKLVADVRAHLAVDAPVGEHTADQLVLLCALAGGGVFRTLPPSLHLRTNVDVIQRFLPVDVALRDDGGTCVVEVSTRP